MRKILRDIKKYIFSTDDFSLAKYNDGFRYPVDLEFTLEEQGFYYRPVDESGIPYKVYASVGRQYNPTRIAAYALAHYNSYIGDQSQFKKQIFLKCADWFLERSTARYEYNFDWEDLKAPWISCMAQGEAASVLVRAYKLTGNNAYLEQAEKSLEPLYCSIDEGGVQSKLSDGSLFVEEYPSKNPTHVLNGFLYTLIGLGEVADVTGSQKHKELFSQLIASLRHNIGLWSYRKWSLYEDPATANGINYCTPSYHNLQLSQLKWLCQRVDAPEIEKFLVVWEGGLSSLSSRLCAFCGKVYFRLLNRAQR